MKQASERAGQGVRCNVTGKRAHSSARRRLRFESLEPRQLLAGDTYLVNFQLAGAPVPTRYLADTGQVFGDRGGGLFYGWSTDHTDVSRDRNVLADQRLDTLIHFHQGQKWEFQLANGNYEVTVAVGDPANNDGLHTINVEGVNFWNAVADTDTYRVETLVGLGERWAAVRRSRNGGRKGHAHRLHPDRRRAERRECGPRHADHHRAGHRWTDRQSERCPHGVGRLFRPGWQRAQIDRLGTLDHEPAPAPVWQTLGIMGVERLHTHLGDGIFINSHAGRTSLLPNTDYELRVRFRDDAGSVSGYAVRSFHTGEASAIFPMEINDVASLPASYWVTTTGVNVVLPFGSPVQPQLRLEGAAGELLLRVAGFNGASNSVTNPAALADHAQVRAVIVAGSNPMILAATNLTFVDELNALHTIYLPPMSLAAGQRIDLWVASTGATYYGTAAQTQPDFSNLARASDTVFTALQAGFVVEEVAGNFQLPTNIAFVPNPGPNPNDPLFYVTELYGSIKVVTRNFSVSNYATGLLNFDPTGNFPGSGEQGLAGIVVDPASGDLFVTRVTSSTPGVESAPTIRRSCGSPAPTAVTRPRRSPSFATWSARPWANRTKSRTSRSVPTASSTFTWATASITPPRRTSIPIAARCCG